MNHPEDGVLDLKAVDFIGKSFVERGDGCGGKHERHEVLAAHVHDSLFPVLFLIFSEVVEYFLIICGFVDESCHVYHVEGCGFCAGEPWGPCHLFFEECEESVQGDEAVLAFVEWNGGLDGCRGYRGEGGFIGFPHKGYGVVGVLLHEVLHFYIHAFFFFFNEVGECVFRVEFFPELHECVANIGEIKEHIGFSVVFWGVVNDGWRLSRRVFLCDGDGFRVVEDGLDDYGGDFGCDDFLEDPLFFVFVGFPEKFLLDGKVQGFVEGVEGSDVLDFGFNVVGFDSPVFNFQPDLFLEVPKFCSLDLRVFVFPEFSFVFEYEETDACFLKEGVSRDIFKIPECDNGFFDGHARYKVSWNWHTASLRGMSFSLRGSAVCILAGLVSNPGVASVLLPV